MNASKAGGNLFVITGPSGSGKDEIISILRRNDDGRIRTAITAVTRPPRPNERNGVNHYFLSRDEFDQWKAADKFLEWAEVYGRCYGTPRQEVDDPLARGQDILLRVDIQGARSVRQSHPNAVLIFIAPPSAEELHRRLLNRETEDQVELRARLAAFDAEMEFRHECDYVVVNQTGAQRAAAEEVAAIFAHVRAARQPAGGDDPAEGLKSTLSAGGPE